MSTPRQSAPSPIALGALTRDLATGAAARALAGRGRGLAVDAKSSATDLVTQVDRDTERWLVEQLSRLRPDDAVLGEESGPRDGTTGVRWLLDPVDGTVNFVLGLPQWAVSVGVEVDGEVVAGAVCNPVSGETFRAVLGGGAVLEVDGDRTELSGPRAVALDRAVIATGFGYDAKVRGLQAAFAAALAPRIGDLRRLGAASLDLCFVAAGRLDGYVEAGLHPWDFAAAGLVAREAGCITTGLRGRPADERCYVASGAGLAADLAELLESLGADRVLDAGR